ncbi:MAG: dihydroorotate dehydrogenase [Actinomycetota bacterium]|nr:dihydroorotate dehydrogenase [Actinomycetota bacterium]
MASSRLKTAVGPLELSSVLIAASGTVGSVWEWADVADVSVYGAAVAKSVSPEPWTGRPAPRMAPVRTGMLNGIGIQNPGITAWCDAMAGRISRLDVPVWGSAVAEDAAGFGVVAKNLQEAGVTAVEANLSCPNLEDGNMFSVNIEASRAVMAATRSAVSVPLGAKLSPNTPDIVGTARACRDAGADFVVLTNTALGFGVGINDRRPLLSGGVGGYSGPGLKPISLRCVYEVSTAMPDLPIVGCGGVSTGADVAEYLLAGASAVAMGTVHLSEPKAGKRVAREFIGVLDALGASSARDLIGSMRT